MLIKPRIVFTICFLLFINTIQAQEAEVQALNDAFNRFGLYNNGSIDSLPRNATNYNKVAGQLDETFKKFILHTNSQHYQKFTPAKGHTNFKLFRLENGIEIDAVSFTVDSFEYVVFSYKTRDRLNYFIKRITDNKIVFDGHAKISSVDGMYSLEKNRVLLVEATGDHNTSRQSSVIATGAKQWKQLKAFRGRAFGQVPGDYRNKKFVDKRIYFQLECDIDVLLNNPTDANQVIFDERTKTLAYKQYSSNNRFKKIEAKYRDGMFVIDDYYVGEGISADSPVVPQ